MEKHYLLSPLELVTLKSGAVPLARDESHSQRQTDEGVLFGGMRSILSQEAL